MRLCSAFLAYVLLTAALYRSVWGTYEPVSLSLIVLVLVIALAALTLDRGRALPPAMARLVMGLLGLFIAVELVLLWRTPTSPYRPDEHLPLAAATGLGLIGLCVLSYAWKALPGGRWRFAIILAIYFAIGARLIQSWPTPEIDVWHLQQGSAAQLLAGKNPYAAEYPNPYPDDHFFGPGVVKDGMIQSFPYPPLNLLLDLPGYAIGDVRWSLLLAMLATAGFTVAAGRRLGLPAGHPAELAAVALLCHPRGFFVLEMAWTEPFQAMTLAASVWALAGRSGLTSTITLAAALSVKQFGLLWLPAAWSSGRLKLRTLGTALAVSVLLALPFACWDPGAFWRGVYRFHSVSPFRDDSLSVLSAIFLNTGWQPPAAIGFLAAVSVSALVMWRSDRTLTHSVLGAAAIYLAFFAFNKAAHMNYYWLVDALLAMAMVIAAAESTTSVKITAGNEGMRADHTPAVTSSSSGAG